MHIDIGYLSLIAIIWIAAALAEFQYAKRTQEVKGSCLIYAFIVSIILLLAKVLFER